jgi:hypothetical protein
MVAPDESEVLTWANFYSSKSMPQMLGAAIPAKP